MEEQGDLLAVQGLGELAGNLPEPHLGEGVLGEHAVFLEVSAIHPEVLQVPVVRHGSPFPFRQQVLEKGFEVPLGVRRMVGEFHEGIVGKEPERGCVRHHGLLGSSFVQFFLEEEVRSERIGESHIWGA